MRCFNRVQEAETLRRKAQHVVSIPKQRHCGGDTGDIASDLEEPRIQGLDLEIQDGHVQKCRKQAN